MATTIDTLVVELLLNGTGFAVQSKSVERALNGIKNAVREVENKFDAVQSHFLQFASQAQELGNLSTAVRENAEDLQAWGEAIKREGGTAEGFNATVKKLSNDLMSLPFNGGNSPLLGGLSRLGVQFRNLDGSMRKPLAVLKDLSAKFQGMSTAQSLALGQKMGLDDATIQLLQKGRQGLDELLVRYKALGVMSNEDIKTGERLRKMFLNYQQVITALGLRFTRFFLPAAEKVSQGLFKAAQWLQQQGRIIEAFTETFSGLILVTLLVSLYKMRSAFLAGAASALKFAAALLANPITGIVAAVVALGVAIGLLVEDFLAWKEGADSAFGAIYDWFSNLGGKIEWLKERWADFVNIISNSKLGKFLGGLKEFFKEEDEDLRVKIYSELISETAGKIAPINENAQGVQAVRSGHQNIDNSRTVNQSSHIDKIIVNNPQGTFNETMHEAVSGASVNTALQDDGFVG